MVNKTSYVNNIGHRIKELRAKKGLTQVELAQKIGCAQNTIAEWENKKDRLPGKKYLREVASILGVSVDYLISLEKTDNPKISCYAEVTSDFTWPKEENHLYHIEVPQKEYNTDRFSLKIVDDLLVPVVCKEDYAIFEKKLPEDNDIVIVRFPEENNRCVIRVWRQKNNQVMLLGVSLYYIIAPYFFEICEVINNNFSIDIKEEKKQKKIKVEGRLVAVKKILKSVKAYPKINYIYS